MKRKDTVSRTEETIEEQNNRTLEIDTYNR